MLSQSGFLAPRETEIIRVLKVLSEAMDGFVVLGGYAVNAFGQHRFSNDCDLATNRDNVPMIDTALLNEGYTLERSDVLPPIGVTIRAYRKPVLGEPVSVELSVNRVVCTRTRGIWSYGFIQANSVDAIVAGARDSTPSRVAGRNLLVAMKLHAGRDNDSGDVVMLSEGIDWKEVARCAACGSKEQLIKQIEYAIGEISSARFASDLKSNFSMASDMAYRTKRTILGLATLRTLVAQEEFKDSL
jgi:hypothetical protein